MPGVCIFPPSPDTWVALVPGSWEVSCACYLLLYPQHCKHDSALVLLLPALLPSAVNAISHCKGISLFLIPSLSLHIKESAKFLWVLMAGNQHLIVIWKDSLPQTKRLLPPSLDWHHSLWLQLWWVPQQWWKTLGDKLTLISTCASLCVTAQLSSSFKHLFIWLWDQWGIQMKKSPLAALPLHHQEMEAELSLSGAWPLCSTWALKSPSCGGK